MIKNLVDSYKIVFRPKRFGKDVQRKGVVSFSIGVNRVAERGVTKPWRVQSQLTITCSINNQQPASLTVCAGSFYAPCALLLPVLIAKVCHY